MAHFQDPATFSRTAGLSRELPCQAWGPFLGSWHCPTRLTPDRARTDSEPKSDSSSVVGQDTNARVFFFFRLPLCDFLNRRGYGLAKDARRDCRKEGERRGRRQKHPSAPAAAPPHPLRLPTVLALRPWETEWLAFTLISAAIC